MIKKLLILITCLSLLSCSSLLLRKSPPVGMYKTKIASDKDYWQAITINLVGNVIDVKFSSSLVKQTENCFYQGRGIWKEGKIWLNLSVKEKNKPVFMIITPLGNNQLSVFTEKFEDRFYLMHPCKGGASLAGEYFKI